MSIAWRDAMCVGEETVDADHKHLVDLINAFEVAIATKVDHKKIARVLLGLVEYTGEHFAREEELQLAIRYPYHESHRRAHRDVLKKLSDIVGEYSRAPTEQRDRMVRDLASFLKEWLVDHIIQSDLRMKPYVLQMQAQQAEALKRKREAIIASQKMAGVEPQLDP
ncbi:MAG TPA: hemerythrin family protein, partial [Magnetospirillum sp.]|nr:hemerythrin family protein [Magnetospirillum sp.]